jgi:hypothetical protein
MPCSECRWDNQRRSVSRRAARSCSNDSIRFAGVVDSAVEAEELRDASGTRARADTLSPVRPHSNARPPAPTQSPSWPARQGPGAWAE